MNSGNDAPPPAQGSIPPPLPPELPPTPAACPGQRRPFGFWATLGWSSLIAFAGLMTQGAVLFAYGFTAEAMGVNVPDDPALLAQNGLVLALATIASAPIVVGLSCVIASMRRGYPITDYLGLHFPDRRTATRWVVVLIGFVIASDLTTVAIGRSIVPEFMIYAMKTAVFPPLLWFAVIVAAPLSEEFFFRGFFFKGLESSTGRGTAIIVTSALWTVIHQQYDVYQMAWIFSAGILLGIARTTTGSLLLCVAIHALMNLIATVEAAIYMAQ